jgi:hypothetical protein
MYCLDVAKGLQQIWVGNDDTFGSYSPLFASANRILAFGAGGELILVDAEADQFRIVSRLALFDNSGSQRAQMLSHPALVNTRLYVRGEKEIVCADLGSAG